MRCDAMRCDGVGIGWTYASTRRAHGSRETKWNYRCDCHWSISVRRGSTDKGSINDSLHHARRSLPPADLTFSPFFRKITHGGHLFVCSVRLLGPCSEIDRRLRPTDVCSAATALTFAPPQKYHWVLSPLIFFSALFFLMHQLLIRFLPAWEASPRVWYSLVRASGARRENLSYAHTYQHACTLIVLYYTHGDLLYRERFVRFLACRDRMQFFKFERGNVYADRSDIPIYTWMTLYS